MLSIRYAERLYSQPLQDSWRAAEVAVKSTLGEEPREALGYGSPSGASWSFGLRTGAWDTLCSCEFLSVTEYHMTKWVEPVALASGASYFSRWQTDF